MIKVDYASRHNLLAQEPLVPELLQDDATPEKLGEALLQQLLDKERHAYVVQRFTEFHQQLNKHADRQAAQAVLEKLGITPPQNPESTDAG